MEKRSYKKCVTIMIEGDNMDDIVPLLLNFHNFNNKKVKVSINYKTNDNEFSGNRQNVSEQQSVEHNDNKSK